MFQYLYSIILLHSLNNFRVSLPGWLEELIDNFYQIQLIPMLKKSQITDTFEN